MSRTLTLWGYALIALAAIVLQARAVLGRRTVTLGQALTSLKQRPAPRVLLLASWLWFGWHTFVRAS